ncbi:MAG: SH3 domain-containing protein [Treponema sp.]|nr:SH3 domain-containing protein [Treponema sp.]
MKRLVLLAVMAVVLTAAAAAQVSKGQTVYVTAKSLPIKSSTGFFAKTVATLSYGDAVTVLSVNGKWAEVRSGNSRTGVSGWTAQTNLTTKRVTATGGTGSASSREVAMAGKGFSEEVENVYKSDHNLNYAAVDATEANTVSEDELLSFVTEGRLFKGDEQ